MTTSNDPSFQESIISEDSSHKGSNDKKDDTIDEEPDNDDDITAGNRCGFGPCRPGWLQIFAKPICFVIFLNTYCFLEGTIISGKVIFT